jgi:hypothetical protein
MPQIRCQLINPGTCRRKAVTRLKDFYLMNSASIPAGWLIPSRVGHLFIGNGLPAARVPCASRDLWRSPKLASHCVTGSDKGSLHPQVTAMLGCTDADEKIPHP